MLKKDVESLKTGDLLHIKSPYNGYGDHKNCHSIALVIARPTNNGEKLGDFFTIQSVNPYNDCKMSRSEHFMPQKSLEDFCHGTINHIITQEQLDRLFSVSKHSERADIFDEMIRKDENGLGESVMHYLGLGKPMEIMPNQEASVDTKMTGHKAEPSDF